MNFTREPIIETVITPREGCKLVIRNSKGNGQEDYYVDAIEVVSFGHSFFFRSQERPKSFLVPVSDYEVLELKETRMVLKNVSSDRSIKIGGGRETPPRAPREEPPRDEMLAESRPAPERSQDQQQQRPMGKRDKRRRGRRGRDRHDYPQQQQEGSYQRQEEQRPHEPREQGEEMRPPEDHLPPESHDSFPPGPEMVEENKAPSFISKLFPPPPTLIKESLSRYKPQESTEEIAFEEKGSFEESIFEHPTSSDHDSEDDNEE